MGAIDLNRIAIGMGKTIKLLSDLEPQISNSYDVYEHKESLYLIAYICRISILDKIDNNSWINITTPITIPMGIFYTRKETIFTGLMLTVEKVKTIASINLEISQNIESILEKGSFFYEFENILPTKFKSKL